MSCEREYLQESQEHNFFSQTEGILRIIPLGKLDKALSFTKINHWLSSLGLLQVYIAFLITVTMIKNIFSFVFVGYFVLFVLGFFLRKMSNCYYRFTNQLNSCLQAYKLWRRLKRRKNIANSRLFAYINRRTEQSPTLDIQFKKIIYSKLRRWPS